MNNILVKDVEPGVPEEWAFPVNDSWMAYCLFWINLLSFVDMVSKPTTKRKDCKRESWFWKWQSQKQFWRGRHPPTDSRTTWCPHERARWNGLLRGRRLQIHEESSQQNGGPPTQAVLLFTTPHRQRAEPEQSRSARTSFTRIRVPTNQSRYR